MARYREHILSTDIRDRIWREFSGVIAGLKTSVQVNRFLSDLLNRQERLMLARRLHIAALLEAGFTYQEIRKLLKAGKTTIARVHRWLDFGRQGYKQAIRLLNAKDKSELRRRLDLYYKKK